MDYTSFTLALPPSPLVFSPTSLYALLLTLPDHRHKRGLRYPRAPMLLIALFAKLLGCNSVAALAQFAKLHAAQLVALLNLPRQSMPHATTWTRLLTSAVDHTEFERLSASFFADLAQPTSLDPNSPSLLCLDGKTLRGTIPAGQTQGEHLLAIYDPQRAVVVAQQAVGAKTNEIPGCAEDQAASVLARAKPSGAGV